MKTQMRNCIITSEDGNNYMVRRSDLFLFIWRFGLKRHSSLFNITNQEGNINLYISKNAQIIINLCKIIEAAFVCYVSFPFVMRLALILPSYRESDLLVTTLFICGAFSGYVVKVLVASFLVPHVRWLTLKPDMDSVDFQFKIEQGKNAGMWIVYPVLIIEIISFFVIFF